MELSFNGPSGTLQVALAVLLGLGTLGYGGYSYAAQSTALGSSETVEATVISTGVESTKKQHGTSYTPRVTFNYTYDGERYTSTNVYPGELPREFDSESEARAQLDGYAAGQTVDAYVRPSAPGNAYLKHEQSDKPLLVMGFGALFLLGTAVSVVRN
ncbi:DUF3592 domain-containing protein [Haloarcula laminariae]|uniref:DUF3592 domain-containing protein n=1 Tax=Haloarcula laminariae TaxID=2961577 RepID=UPI0021CAA92B|nr:DUF3592 domain-containing protein [Halomicroarcula laminariae]